MSKYIGLARAFSKTKVQPKQRMQYALDAQSPRTLGGVVERGYRFITFTPSLSTGGITFPDRYSPPTLTSASGQSAKVKKQMSSSTYRYSSRRKKYVTKRKRYRY